MKANIHPPYYRTTVTCACGASFETGSTRENLSGNLLSVPSIYTGQRQKIVDTGGRVERFRQKYNLPENKPAVIWIIEILQGIKQGIVLLFCL